MVVHLHLPEAGREAGEKGGVRRGRGGRVSGEGRERRSGRIT